MPSMVTRPVITSMANAIRLHWRRVVAVTWGWKQWKSATISTIGALRCGVGVVVLYNATLHDNGPPYLIFGEGIVISYGIISNEVLQVFKPHGFLFQGMMDVGAVVVVPHFLRPRLRARFAVVEEQHVGLNAVGVKNPTFHRF